MIPPVVDVTGVTLSPKTSTAEAGENGNRQLTATVEPTDADNKNITFVIESAEGLTVSENGKIEWTAETPAGDYTTTVTTEDGNYTDSHTLTLTEPDTDPEEGE